MKRIIIALFMFSPLFTQADTELIGSGVNIRGKIYKASCSVNDGKEMVIPFNNIDASRIGDDYAKEYFIINYKCNGTSTNKFMRVTGVATEFNEAAIQSGKDENFGIQLDYISDDGDSQPLKLNSSVNIPASSNSLIFSATPVKKTGAVLQSGEFTVSATLEIMYP